MLQATNAPFSILDKHDLHFRELDVVSSTLHKDDVGEQRKGAPVLEVEHENIFWESGLLGYSTPRYFQRAVFFYRGLHFALRGFHKHYDLISSLILFSTSVYNSSVYYQYWYIRTINIDLKT